MIFLWFEALPIGMYGCITCGYLHKGMDGDDEDYVQIKATKEEVRNCVTVCFRVVCVCVCVFV